MTVLGEKNWPIKTIVTDPLSGERIMCTFTDLDHMLFVVNQWQMTFGADIKVKIKTLGAQDN
jgi:hypothetical protein